MRTLVVATGGAVGALARYGLGRVWPSSLTGFPTATFLVNLLGAGALGLFLGWWEHAGKRGELLPPFVAVGVLGGLTTFSTLAVEAVDRFDHHASGTAAVYLVASVVGGIAAVALGAHTGRRIGKVA